MRLFLLALVTALIVPFAAYAQALKQVEVVNDPLTVEVVNPAPPSPLARWQLVGFTSATYTGAMGGNFGVTQKCQLEFPNSRMCTLQEVKDTTSIPSGLAGDARMRKTTSSEFCTEWRSTTGENGSVSADGSVSGNAADCASSIQLACCALVP